MRRLISLIVPALLIACLLIAAPGCKRKRRRAVVETSDDGVFASMIDMSDPRSKVQLVKGFYDLEAGAWRWTARQFDVVLSPPRDAAQKGAQLVLRFSIPEAVIEKLKPMTLSASVNGVKLPPERYSTAGDFTYTRELPASALNTGNVPVSFTLDKALPPSTADTRELGVVVKQVGLELK